MSYDWKSWTWPGVPGHAWTSAFFHYVCDDTISYRIPCRILSRCFTADRLEPDRLEDWFPSLTLLFLFKCQASSRERLRRVHSASSRAHPRRKGNFLRGFQTILPISQQPGWLLHRHEDVHVCGWVMRFENGLFCWLPCLSNLLQKKNENINLV